MLVSFDTDNIACEFIIFVSYRYLGFKEKMDEEILLAMKNAEHHKEQRRLLNNETSQTQRTINLTDGLSPYVISKMEKLIDCPPENIEAPTSSESMYTSYPKLRH